MKLITTEDNSSMENRFFFLEKAVPRTDRKVFWSAFAVGLVFFILDQLTKYWVVKEIPFAARKTVIPGFFNLTYITNTGAAWGILSGRYWLLLTISGTVFAAAFFFLRALTDSWKERYYAIFLVMSGIVGNSADRIFRGAVVDFLQFYVDRYAWPSFNVADSCICVGVFIYVLSTLLRPEHKKADPDSPSYVQLQK